METGGERAGGHTGERGAEQGVERRGHTGGGVTSGDHARRKIGLRERAGGGLHLGGADGARGGGRTDQGQAAVVVEKEEAELGVAKVRSQVVGGNAELPLALGQAVVFAGHGAAGGGVGQRAETEEDVLSADAGVVVRAEIRTARVDVGLLDGEQVEGVEGEGVGHGDRAGDHGHGLEGLAQLGARGAQAGDVDRVDGVDAVRDEGALAPAEHLAAEAEVGRHAAGVELVAQVGVEQADVALDFAAAQGAERHALMHGAAGFEVLEVGSAEEASEAAVFELQIVGALGDQ
ncbi:MAG: hypothetical protein IPL39_22560 [Opitutaceae bacterium]|nr:hypothetical protein [Opitutaceae bacterium]